MAILSLHTLSLEELVKFDFKELDPKKAEHWKEKYKDRKKTCTDKVDLRDDIELAFVQTSLILKLIDELKPRHIVFRSGCKAPASKFSTLEMYVCAMNSGSEELLGKKVYKCSDTFDGASGDTASSIPEEFESADAFYQLRLQALRMPKKPRGIAFEVDKIRATGVLEKTYFAMRMAFNNDLDFVRDHNTVIVQAANTRAEVPETYTEDMKMYDHGNQCCPIQ